MQNRLYFISSVSEHAVLQSEVPLVISRPVLLQFVSNLGSLQADLQQPVAT
jgi:hypothetical protein